MEWKACVLACAACLAAAGGVLADIVWEYPFDELDGVWTSNGRWGQDADSAWIHRDRSILGGGGGPETKYIAFELTTVPWGVDSLTLDMDHTWNLSGYAISGGWGASVAATALVDGSDSSILFYESATGSSDGPRGGRETEHLQCTLQASAGQTLLLSFDAFTNLWGTISEVHLDWVLRNMTLTGHCPEALENRTWAEVKALFPRISP